MICPSLTCGAEKGVLVISGITVLCSVTEILKLFLMFIKSILEKKSMTNARSTWIEIHFDSLGQRKGSKEGQLASKKDSNSIYFLQFFSLNK